MTPEQIREALAKNDDRLAREHAMKNGASPGHVEELYADYVKAASTYHDLIVELVEALTNISTKYGKTTQKGFENGIDQNMADEALSNFYQQIGATNE